MKKLAAIFVLAVLIPSAILAWLASRSLRDQEIILENQRALLHQSTTDALAADVTVYMDDIRVYFRNLVDELLAEQPLGTLASNFDEAIRVRWAQVQVGAVVGNNGVLLSPKRTSPDPRIQSFCTVNESFLTNRDAAEVYEAPPPLANTIAVEVERQAPKAYDELRKSGGDLNSMKPAPAPAGLKEKVSVQDAKLSSRIAEQKKQALLAKEEALKDAGQEQVARSIIPYGQRESLDPAQQRDAQVSASRWSNLVTTKGDFRELVGENREGAFSRFLENELTILLWYRPETAPGYIFLAQLNLEMLRSELGKIISGFAPGSDEEIGVALLEETGKPLAVNVPGFVANWKKPFVASEVGEILPHWEVAAYLLNPGALNRAAKGFRLTLGLMILVLVAAIGFGSLLIIVDVGRQMKLARQKTDFVSNVSHELKTPLTSIRMFSDLLIERRDGVSDSKQREYAGVISSEAARLTRLINNLLDFSRIERGERKYCFESIELVPFVRETVDHYRAHLESHGFRVAFRADGADDVTIKGDRDALSQVILNLISNAEKYGSDGKEIDIEIEQVPEGRGAEIRVLDRGPGIGRKHRERIFEKFYRVDDSLSSGIQGSGLGLTLARQIVKAHGGEVQYRSREGVGSCFVVAFPAA